MPQSISSRKLLLVEGKDEEVFILKILSLLQITDVTIITVDGKPNFKKELIALSKREDFDTISHIAVIRDSDSNFASSFQSTKDALSSINLTPPLHGGEFTSSTPKVGIFMMPDNNSIGELEDLCLTIIQNQDIISCVDKYHECIKSILTPEKIPKKLSKSKLLTYLSAMPEYSNTIKIASEKLYFNFEHSNLNLLKYFLQHFQD